MVKHLSIRLAWHDSNWNGCVCERPEENVYCVGSHSLLSERLERERNIDIEKAHPGKKMDTLGDYIPPCFWSCKTFSKDEAKIHHKHPFDYDVPPIPETMKGYSAFSWPFSISFSKTENERRTFGSYKPTLEQDLERFLGQFTPKKTLIFFYLNYDNAVAPEDGKYVLAGVSPLHAIGKSAHFQFEKEKLNNIRKSPRMKHFPTINWAIQFHHAFDDAGVLIPYKPYLDLIRDQPDDAEFFEKLLDECKVIIEEPSLIPNFKYVAMDVDEDNAIYLLYKIKKSLEIMQEHSISDCAEQINRVSVLLKQCWQQRGLYPSIGRILDYIHQKEISYWEELGSGLEQKFGKELHEILFSEKIKDFVTDDIFKGRENELYDLILHIEDLDDDSRNLCKLLSLFSLTSFQIKRILNLEKDAVNEIGKKELTQNPYALAEIYKPIIDPETGTSIEDDNYIDIFKIDIGLFPDSIYTDQRDFVLQRFLSICPQRLRAITIEHLKSEGQNGDCYVLFERVMKHIIENPLFYKTNLNLDKERVLHDSKYRKHFSERIAIKESDDSFFYYLKEIDFCEQFVRSVITDLLEREPFTGSVDVDNYLDKCISQLEQNELFDADLFPAERKRLYNALLPRSFFVLSGKPGSGKTTELKEIVRQIRSLNQSVTLLAPTGKSVLRINAKLGEDIAETIDRYIVRNKYGDCLDNLDILMSCDRDKLIVDNLIIDESSMIDLVKLSVLFSMIEVRSIKRIILVGDENQLPPIGFGKPLYDIINFIKFSGYEDTNYIKLESNCRETGTGNVLSIAESFAENSKFFEETMQRLKEGGQISEGINLIRWKNQDELHEAISCEIDQMMDKLKIESKDKKSERFNLLHGLTESGYYQPENCSIDNFQILSPYRGAYFGTLGVNEFIRQNYREKHRADNYVSKGKSFFHADKIIRINNWYKWGKNTKSRDLVLSNGSIGLAVNQWSKKKNRYYREFYFPEGKNNSLPAPEKFWGIDDEENFELAYGITVHKAQGSDFEHVFFILPNKYGLLCKELVYTALTRSRCSLTILLHDVAKEDLLDVARARSAILTRNTSLFSDPVDNRLLYEPKVGIHVRSKIECLIYQALDLVDSLKVEYEVPLKLPQLPYNIHPDFTIYFNNKIYYLEHLGMLDDSNYMDCWEQRKKAFEDAGLINSVITTDDLNGYSRNVVLRIAEDLKNDKVKQTPNSYSNHHYDLNANYPVVELTSRTETLQSLLENIEGKQLEFKSTLCTNLRTGKKDDNIEISAMKSIAAFFNTEGGKLVLGYHEKNKQVIGIETDFPFLKHQDLDGFGLKIDTLINNHFGKEFNSFIKIDYKEIDGKILCIVDVLKSPADAFLKIKGKEPEFYIRLNSSTQKLNIMEYNKYKERKFENS